MPRLKGSRTTWAPAFAATAAVRSVEPSSTTTTSSAGSKARISRTTPPIASSSFRAGTIATPRSARGGDAAAAGLASSDVDDIPHPDQLQQSPRPVDVRVLVEHALARPCAHRLGRARILEQLPIRLDRLVRARDDEQLPARLEPALDALVRVRDDRGGAARQLEGPGRGGHRHGRVRAPREIEVHARRRDRLREDVERHVADQPRLAGVAAEVPAAEREPDVLEPPA